MINNCHYEPRNWHYFSGNVRFYAGLVDLCLTYKRVVLKSHRYVSPNLTNNSGTLQHAADGLGVYITSKEVLEYEYAVVTASNYPQAPNFG